MVERHERPHSAPNVEIITDATEHFFAMLACAGILADWGLRVANWAVLAALP
ncbi:hypothetical protein [Streptomyces sp. 4N124]|uniref:hypothetical protein n=1 Tax=Streptomyces sp. 4N124 TaxID=3457420 RepID=UPI003FD03B83